MSPNHLWDSFLLSTGATNESGFTALPGGGRSYIEVNTFSAMLDFGYWWTFAADGTINAWSRSIPYYDIDVNTNSINKHNGFSVRCIKD